MSRPTIPVSLPWNSWQESHDLKLDFPGSWSVEVFAPADLPEVSESEIAGHAQRLIKEIERTRPARVVLAVDDLTRPLSYRAFFDPLIEFWQTHAHRPQITVVVGLGTHGPLSSRELEWKLGSACVNADFLQVLNHNYKSEVADAGFEWGNIRVQVNRHFLQADFRVVLSTVVPHPFAGFSGGAKMVWPGLSSIEVTRRSHQMALMGFAGKPGTVHNNKFRRIIDGFLDQLPVHYFVGFLTDARRRCVFVDSGEIRGTYQRVVQQAESFYRVSLPEDARYDVVWLNAYPKDTELVQLDTGFLPVLTAGRSFWSEDAIFVLSGSASKGVGKHGLFEPGGLLYRAPRPKRFLAGRPLWLFLPGVSSKECHQLFWDQYPHFQSLGELRNALSNAFPEAASVAIFPAAAITIVEGAGEKQ
ncbi:MAG: DUF2088 domain-containing protein [Calditrichaeota bacterium]|nr:MAG: DUF2088 domain-containing protein [Calditrichota bacterium]